MLIFNSSKGIFLFFLYHHAIIEGPAFLLSSFTPAPVKPDAP